MSIEHDYEELAQWIFRRNLVIYISHEQGLSDRLLSDVFKINRDKVNEIVREMQDYGRSLEPGEPDNSGPDSDQLEWESEAYDALPEREI